MTSMLRFDFTVWRNVLHYTCDVSSGDPQLLLRIEQTALAYTSVSYYYFVVFACR